VALFFGRSARADSAFFGSRETLRIGHTQCSLQPQISGLLEKRLTMNLIAPPAYSMPAIRRLLLQSTLVAGVFTLLSACAGFTPSIGVSVPIGRVGGVGVSVGGNGTVSGSVGVGVGGGSVSVGGTGRLPTPAPQSAEPEKKEEKKP
jgi:hypothetical protein